MNTDQVIFEFDGKNMYQPPSNDVSSMIVMKEETVQSSDHFQGEYHNYNYGNLITEDYTEEIGGDDSADGMDIAQEVLISNDQDDGIILNDSNLQTADEEGVMISDYGGESSNGVMNKRQNGFLDKISESRMIKVTEQIPNMEFKKRRGRPPKFSPSEVDEDGKTWYACTVCGEKYSDRSELMYHMRQHNAQRPFHCPDCGKTFRQQSHLNVHVRIHTGEKPFACGVCGKAFRQKAIVDQHMRTHTQLRPYACTYDNCFKKFGQKTSFDNHIKSHKTGRLSESYKKNQEIQKYERERLEALRLAKTTPKVIQINEVMPNGLTRQVKRVLGGALVDNKIKTTVVKMTLAQFKEHQARQAAQRQLELQKASNSSQSSNDGSQVERQKAATGPFMAYVNISKPILQREQPGLSLLDTLRTLASRWNQMQKEDKEKFARIAEEEKVIQQAITKVNPVKDHRLNVGSKNSFLGDIASPSVTTEMTSEAEQDQNNSILNLEATQDLDEETFGHGVEGEINMEGVVFHVGDDPSSADLCFGGQQFSGQQISDGTIYRINDVVTDDNGFSVGGDDDSTVFGGDEGELVFDGHEYHSESGLNENNVQRQELEAEMELERQENAQFVARTVNLEYKHEDDEQTNDLDEEISLQYKSHDYNEDASLKYDNSQQFSEDSNLQFSETDQGRTVSLVSLGEGGPFDQPDLGDGAVIQFGNDRVIQFEDGAEMGQMSQMDIGGSTIFFINNIPINDDREEEVTD